jgi:Tol biopolymer transport system component
MVYVSYPDEVPAGSHPANKRVMLRIQPVNSKESRVIAWLYGGQGTMNVPSWSPDSRKIAFVSYTFGDPKK